jgi:hypothetical protein
MGVPPVHNWRKEEVFGEKKKIQICGFLMRWVGGTFHEINHPAIKGYPHDLGKPQMEFQTNKHYPPFLNHKTDFSSCRLTNADHSVCNSVELLENKSYPLIIKHSNGSFCRNERFNGISLSKWMIFHCHVLIAGKEPRNLWLVVWLSWSMGACLQDVYKMATPK